MKRIAKVLVTAALVVVLMATTVSPAFAGPYNHKGNGWGVDGYNGGCDDTTSHGEDGSGANAKPLITVDKQPSL